MRRRSPGAPRANGGDLAETLGHRFARPDLLESALVHPSAAKAPAGAVQFQRLEFLGDRVLGVVIADLLLKRFPREPEGSLARRYAALVNRDALVDVAREVGLGPHLRLGKSEEEAGGRDAPTILADACEAVIGALYLDGGLPAAARFIERAWERLIRVAAKPPQDPKTALQEWAQGAGRPLPVYRTLSIEGPSHAPIFTIEVEVEGFPPVVGRGSSKRAAEQDAAAALLSAIASADER